MGDNLTAEQVLAILYIQRKDLSQLTPEEIYGLYRGALNQFQIAQANFGADQRQFSAR